MNISFQRFCHTGLALDPIHVGTGGARLGRVDLSIVRDPVTRVPKIPGSSLAGVMRTYVAMSQQEQHPDRQIDGKPKPYYPDCAGLGQPKRDGGGGHCGQADCPVCTVFGFAKGKDSTGGFAGLAAFSDADVLLFPVATQKGPVWVMSPEHLRIAGLREPEEVNSDAIYCGDNASGSLNLGWLMLPVRQLTNHTDVSELLNDLEVPSYITHRFAMLSDKLFTNVVNSNLEVRTSVSISPETGAAEGGALFTYEALPRGTVLYWKIISKNPAHFRIEKSGVSAVKNTNDVHGVVKQAYGYLEHLGIGGMGTRGMGRLRVLNSGGQCNISAQGTAQSGSQSTPMEASQ